MREVCLAIALLSVTAFGDDGWKFLGAYPAQYQAVKLSEGESITIDGNLDEPAWEGVPWVAEPFIDIAQRLYPTATIPQQYQTQVKVRWDDEYLYVGAVLGEEVVWANITGHNDKLTGKKAPWWNNDFEVFVDVSGSTHNYKEFEMNARNATYDVLWRVPDKGMNSLGVPCADSSETMWCQNSTYNAPSPRQTWTMAPRLRTAAKAPSTDFDPLSPPAKMWSVEIAFPIRGTMHSGGLLDAAQGVDYSVYDPTKGGRYWFVNFARAEHPLSLIGGKALDIDYFTPEYLQTCQQVKDRHPTLLGTGPWSCYYEWVWQDMRATQYMHNPEFWGVVEFVRSGAYSGVCRMPNWPARHVASQIYRAEVQHLLAHGSYASDPAVLVQSRYCNVSTSCDSATLRDAVGKYAEVFNITLKVNNSATHCVDYIKGTPTGGPCFSAAVTAAKGPLVTIAEDRHVTSLPAVPQGCL